MFTCSFFSTVVINKVLANITAVIIWFRVLLFDKHRVLHISGDVSEMVKQDLYSKVKIKEVQLYILKKAKSRDNKI